MPFISFFVDFAPLITFFIVFKAYGLMEATATLVVVTLLTLPITYMMKKKIPVMPLVTALLVAGFGGLTLWLDDDRFIKMKPTIINLVFAAVLLIGVWKQKALLKHVMGASMALSDKAWLVLSRRWGLFFILLAVINEVVWRFFPTETWVNFKVFGLLALIFLFTLLQLPFMHRELALTEGKSELKS